MKAVILAAGEGKRLRPFTETMPKVMLPVGNKPILEHVVDALKNAGVEEIVIVVGYKKESILEHFKDYNGIDISYVAQDKQLGTAHALLQAKQEIKDDYFLVVSGDNIIDQDSLSCLMEETSEYSLLVKENPFPSKYGVVSVENNVLEKIVEKPRVDKGRFVSTGIYKFPSGFLDELEKSVDEGVFALSSVLQSVVENGKKVEVRKARLWEDIVYPWDLIQVNEKLIQNMSGFKAGVIEDGAVLKGPVEIGRDCKIYSGCYIVGPVVIGEGCEIGPNACIFPSTVVGENSVVRPFSEIRNSVLMEGTHVGSSSFVSHSVVGRNTVLGNSFSNVVGKATMEINDEFKKLDKTGFMIGENSTLGSNVVVDPGVIIGRNCEVSSLKKIDENVSSNVEVM